MNTERQAHPLVIAIVDGVTLIGALDEHTMLLENPAKVIRQYGQRPSATVRGAIDNFTSLTCCAAFEFVSIRGLPLSRGVRILSLDEDIVPGERKEVLDAYDQWMQAAGQIRAAYSGVAQSGLIVLPGGRVQ